MDYTEHKTLDVETLEKMTFERSKNWSNFLNELANIKKEEELLLSDLEDTYGVGHITDDSGDDNSIEVSEEMVELEEEEALRDITNRNCTFGTSVAGAAAASVVNGMSLRNLSLLVQRGRESVNVMEEDMNLLNQTLPVLAEHERIWKEEGIDKILNSFDPQKIEEKVGGWLRRNHGESVYHGALGQQSSRNGFSSGRYYKPIVQSVKSVSRRLSPVVSETDTESVDTARYILSSRRRHGVAQRKLNSSATTTTIKTFRLVQSKRDALHKKYACPDHNDEAHLNELRCRRTHSLRRRCHETQSRQRQVRCRSTKELRTLRATKSTRVLPRRCETSHPRKYLHKHRGASNVAIDTCSSFSESVDTDEECDLDTSISSWGFTKNHVHSHRVKCLKERVRHRSACRSHHNTLNLSLSTSTSSSYLSPLSSDKTYNVIHNKLHDESMDLGEHPCKCKSCYRCRNEEKLCEKTRQFNGEKLIKKCDTPVKPVMSQQPLYYTAKSNKCDSDDSVHGDVRAKTSHKGELVKVKKMQDNKQPFYKKKQKSMTKTTSSITKNELEFWKKDNAESESESETEKAFNRELKIAIENSKKTFEERQQIAIELPNDKITKTIKELQLNTPAKESKRSVNYCEIGQSKEKFTKSIQEQQLNTPAKEVRKDVYSNEIEQAEEKFKSIKALQLNTPAKEMKRAVNYCEIGQSKEKFTKSIQAHQLNTPAKEVRKDVYSNEIEQADENFKSIKALQLYTPVKELTKAAIPIKRSYSSLANSFGRYTPAVDVLCTPAQIKKIMKPQPKSARLRKLEKYSENALQTETEELLFSSLSIRNSTALVNDKAIKREIFSTTATTFVGVYPNSIATAVKQRLNPVTVCSKKSVDPCSSTRIDKHTFSVAPSSCDTMQKFTGADFLSQTAPTSDSESDCIIVSSTTGGYHSQQQTQPFQASLHPLKSSNDILLYTPKNKTLTPAHSFCNGCFNITEEHMSSVIGKKAAHIFLKYYTGKRRFDDNSTVYFRPPQDASVLDDSKNDLMEVMGACGYLYEMYEIC